jgi:cobalt/nickel transport system permease protein
MIGTLFIRSYEHGERVYTAMVARGYDGQSRVLNRLSLKTADILFVSGMTLVLVTATVLIYLMY